MEQIFKGIFAIILALIFISLFFYLIGKYLGITATSKYSSKQRTDLDNLNEYSKRQLSREIKLNPKIVEIAKQNIKKKRYATTYNNLVDEIEQVKKTHPNILKKENIENLESNEDVERLKRKNNISEFEKKNIESPEFLRILKKVNTNTNKGTWKLTEKENEVYNSLEFKNWHKEYISNYHSFVDKTLEAFHNKMLDNYKF